MKKIITHSALNYAQALFETGQNFEKDLNTVCEVLSCCDDFNNIISNPAVDISVKYAILDEIFQDKIDSKVLQFIKILTERNRLNEFTQIQSAYKEKIDKVNNIQNVEIVSAIELDNETKNKITEKLSTKLHKKIVPQWNIDNEIISGLVFKIDDNIIDASLLNKIESISKNIR